MPLEDANYYDLIMKDLENYKELFADDKIIQILVDHLGYLVRIEPDKRSKYEIAMMELIIVLVRNILLIPCRQGAKNIQGAYKSNIQSKLYSCFAASGGGMFDALVFFCQDFTGELMQK